jgi:short-subunit dehydrogenase
MDLGLKGKNAAVSGSSQGIGYAIARALAAEGCNLALSARGKERLDQAVKEMEELGVKAVGVVCDLSTDGHGARQARHADRRPMGHGAQHQPDGLCAHHQVRDPAS